MKVLGIETSCDETAAAVVEDGVRVLGNVIASQVDLHAKTGGVVPEVAAREHVLKIVPVLDECMSLAGCSWDDISAVAVTRGPGLVSSLIIGTEAANVISYVEDKVLVPVQHVVGHIYANWLEVEEEIECPVLVLTVSGGHNELILMRGHGDFEVLGETRDDAAGEAFDKVARILGLGYPGGPAIAEMALKGDGSAYALPRILLERDSLDFSFSGLKTAVLSEVKKGEVGKADLAASFQEAVVEVLAEKIMRVLKGYDVKEVHLAGGVSANLRLREVVGERLRGKVKFRFPKKIGYCTDNAAMIAGAGYFLSELGEYRAKTNVIPTTSFEI
ncbi:MAG: tRNA (adenosine(37)-N6)-threonylcarbamoyltransferase complex transferase subunit TsaD [Candidatus Peregrinibacteria bacterium]